MGRGEDPNSYSLARVKHCTVASASMTSLLKHSPYRALMLRLPGTNHWYTGRDEKKMHVPSIELQTRDAKAIRDILFRSSGICQSPHMPKLDSRRHRVVIAFTITHCFPGPSYPPFPLSGRYRCLCAPLAVKTTIRITPPELPSHLIASRNAPLTN